MRRLRIIASLLLLLIGIVFPGKSQERPPWTEGYFEDLPNSYLEVVSGEGRSWEEARDAASKRIIQRRNASTGQSATVSFQAGKPIEVESEGQLVSKNRIIDEFRESLPDGSCRIYLLVQTAKKIHADFEPVRVSDKYPFSARVFVPGMAQIHKGNKGKGAAFIAGECLFLGGIVASECLKAHYESRMNATYHAGLRAYHSRNARICTISRNIAIGGAAALYVWNIIDGIAAKGKPRVFIGNARLDIAPFATGQTGGIALNLNF